MLLEEMNVVAAPLSDAEVAATEGAVIGVAALVLLGAIVLC